MHAAIFRNSKSVQVCTQFKIFVSGIGGTARRIFCFHYAYTTGSTLICILFVVSYLYKNLHPHVYAVFILIITETRKYQSYL